MATLSASDLLSHYPPQMAHWAPATHLPSCTSSNALGVVHLRCFALSDPSLPGTFVLQVSRGQPPSGTSSLLKQPFPSEADNNISKTATHPSPRAQSLSVSLSHYVQ